ncbi:energy-coupling factor ABC transporter ATP-binding protein [Polymorphum gilvum]|uniref:ABC cobalt transporter, ATPase subunit, CbiO n=1 Tax=Polymorphum gilvum (strain LMG 25793 / CGMCC 1.9160 / SL003B-26A1) TaxID=991905 RepID=F2J363_POLGS|nr:ABC transporter ATP-binding protein [Polymorphum gilvum]ADZ69870.1 ABC cobalt transporter, ATPase subunit, CbiO [Polymorphum gilvum SL003B-26A1]
MSDLVALADVTVSRDGTPVLRDVSLVLSAGERLAIVGPNGAGKTTLLRTVVGLQRPDRGSVRLFGVDCAHEKQFRLLRPRIGFLFQDSDDQLFCPTVIEDVAFGPLNIGCTQAEATARAQRALDELGVGHLANRVSHRLSGGEKRLVCLAGLVAMRPDVLLLDEPTNGIDEANGQRLRTALKDFAGAIILVSHDAAFVADFASRAMILEAGRLAPAQIHSHPHVHTHAHVHPHPADAAAPDRPRPPPGRD